MRDSLVLHGDVDDPVLQFIGKEGRPKPRIVVFLAATQSGIPRPASVRSISRVGIQWLVSPPAKVNLDSAQWHFRAPAVR